MGIYIQHPLQNFINYFRLVHQLLVYLQQLARTSTKYPPTVLDLGNVLPENSSCAQRV